MYQSLFPSEDYDSAYDIDFYAYYNKGYRGILFDVDNTLVEHGQPVTIRAIELFARLREAGFKTCIISNNKEHSHKLEMLELGVLYYIRLPIDESYLYHTITNILKLLYVNRRVSPLTGLPGNVQIQAEIKKRILNKEQFSLMYFDLDNFKAYNDVYGFLKGDEIIKFTSKVILKNMHSEELENSFVGHIGGDDFIAIVPGENCESICQNIIAEFDFNVKRYYTAEDSKKGYIQIANRKGIIEEFPLTSISIGVVEVESGKFNNVLEIGEAGAAVKHLAKTIQGSTYVIDRRKKQQNS